MKITEQYPTLLTICELYCKNESVNYYTGYSGKYLSEAFNKTFESFEESALISLEKEICSEPKHIIEIYAGMGDDGEFDFIIQSLKNKDIIEQFMEALEQNIFKGSS